MINPNPLNRPLPSDIKIEKISITIAGEPAEVTPEEFEAICRAAEMMIPPPPPPKPDINDYLRSEATKLNKEILRRLYQKLADALALPTPTKVP